MMRGLMVSLLVVFNQLLWRKLQYQFGRKREAAISPPFMTSNRGAGPGDGLARAQAPRDAS